jgi:molybdopterin synthase catalytic subunit
MVKYMDISVKIAELKQEQGFKENVGMVLVHNGIVRGTTRDGAKTVTSIKVTPDRAKMQAICDEMQSRKGIFRVFAHANEGELFPGDDLLFLFVAGDIRENVKATFAEALDRIKSESVVKQENTK